MIPRYSPVGREMTLDPTGRYIDIDEIQDCSYADLVELHTRVSNRLAEAKLYNCKRIAKALFEGDKKANDDEIAFAMSALKEAGCVKEVDEIVEEAQCNLAVEHAFFRYAASVAQLNQKDEFVDPHTGWEASKSSE